MSKEYTPLVIAKSFTKQYYEIIHKKPQQLYRFYKEESNFFHGDENQSTETISGGDNIREKVESLNLTGAKVDLTDGSIDAQKSDNNAVFLVVTGKFTMPGKTARPFVQSFFLVCQSAGKADAQPSYYVRNSVFRLFGEDVEAAKATPPAPPVELVTTAVFEKKEEVVPVPEPVKEQVVEKVKEPEVTSEEDDTAEKETETPVPETQVDELDVSTVTSEPEYVNVSMKKDAPPVEKTEEETVPKDVKEVIPEPVVVKEKVKPASWACLFAGGTGTPEPAQEAPKPKKVPPVKKDADSDKAATGGPKTLPPPMTTYLCQLPENVTESEVRDLFEPFGPIKKIDIHAQKGFAFVDFTDAASVKNAMAKKGTGYFTIRDTAIQVEERQTKGGMAKNGNNNRDRSGRGGVGGGRDNGGNRRSDGQKKADNKGGNNNTGNRDNRNKNGNKAGGNTKQAAAGK